MGRKYNSYKIMVTYLNGDKEEVKLNGINNNSYKETMKVYNDVKEEYIQDTKISTISFLGQTVNGEIGVMFTKEINIKNNKKPTEEFVQENLSRDVREIVGEINDRMELLIQQKDYFLNKEAICEKRRDTLLHMVSMLENKPFKKYKMDETKYRLNLLRDIELNELERRNVKNNLKDAYGIIENVKKAQEELKPLCKNRKQFSCQPESYAKSVEKTIKYRTDKERLHYMSQFQSKYAKVVNDPAKKELYFYNNVGEGKLKNKKIV